MFFYGFRRKLYTFITSYVLQALPISSLVDLLAVYEIYNFILQSIP
jgi:hypothetical protein